MGDAFNLSDPWVLLRLVCGLFFIPHIAGKLIPPRPALNFFTAARIPAPVATMYLAAAVESIACIGLLFGIQTRWSALLAAATLIVATLAVHRLQVILDKPKWLWNLGGFEYPFFWALACGIVALGAAPAK